MIEVGLAENTPLPPFTIKARLPVKLVPVTLNVCDELLAKVREVLLTEMVGTTHLPVTLTVLGDAPPPLMVMVAECEPAAEGW